MAPRATIHILYLVYLCFSMLHSTESQNSSCQICSTIKDVFRVDVHLDESYGTNCEMRRDLTELKNIVTVVSRVMGQTYNHDYHLEFRLVDTCSDYLVISKNIYESIPSDCLYTSPTSQLNDMSSQCTRNQSKTMLGFASQTQIYDSSFVKTLDRVNLPLLIVSDQFVQPNMSNSVLYGTGYNLESSIKAMFLLMIEMNWDYVTVVYSDDKLGHESLRIYDRLSTRYFVCSAERLPVSFSKPDLSDIKTRGVVYLGSENIGLKVVSASSIPERVWVTSLPAYVQSAGGKVYSVARQQGSPLTDALVYYSKALNQTYTTLRKPGGDVDCQRDSLRFRYAMQQQLSALTTEGSHSTVKDGNLEGLPQSTADTSYRVIMKEGEESEVVTVGSADNITLTDSKKLKHAANASICVDKTCQGICSALDNQDLLYIHGEYIILATIQIRDGMDPKDKWSCTNMTVAGLFRVETAIFTLKKLRSLLNDSRFGLLIMDSCFNYLKTGRDVFGILGDEKRKICEKGDPTKCLDRKKIVGVIGGDSSGTTQQIQTILREIPIIQIAYGSSGTTLSDRKAFPFLLRPNPSDAKQTEYIAQILQQLRNKGNDINAVNIIYSDSLYGRDSHELLRQKLEKNGTCFNLELAIPESEYTTHLLNTIIERLLSSDSKGVNINIMIIDLPHIPLLMDHLNENETLRVRWMTRQPEFTFILSDTWNHNQHLLDKYGHLVKGSFSFTFSLGEFKSTSFEDYLEKWRPQPLHSNNEGSNPFMVSLRELQGQCKVRGSFLTVHDKFCNDDDHPIDVSSLFENDMPARLLMKALTILVYGLGAVNHNNNDNVLFNRTMERVHLTYQYLLSSPIPRTLEIKDRDNGDVPFLEEPTADQNYGDGRTGYLLWQVRATDVQLSKFKFEKICEIEFVDTDEELDLSDKTIEFYSNGEKTTRITSSTRACHDVSSITTTTLPGNLSHQSVTKSPVSNEKNQYVIIIIVLCVINVILFVVGFAVFRNIWKRVHQQKPSVVYTYSNHHHGESNGGFAVGSPEPLERPDNSFTQPPADRHIYDLPTSSQPSAVSTFDHADAQRNISDNMKPGVLIHNPETDGA